MERHQRVKVAKFDQVSKSLIGAKVDIGSGQERQVEKMTHNGEFSHMSLNISICFTDGTKKSALFFFHAGAVKIYCDSVVIYQESPACSE